MASERDLTINEIAQAAGVSRSTVSRVLTGHPNVKPATRKIVEQVIEELHYRPSSVAQGLARGSLNMIGLLIGDIRNTFYAEIARGVEDMAHDLGFMVVICDTDYDMRREQFYFQGVQQFALSGLIVMSVLDQQELLPVLKSIRCPIVMLNRYVRSFESDVVLVDNVEGSYLATKHLIELGHERIGHLSGSTFSTASRDRTLGFERALHDFGIGRRDYDIQEGDLTVERGKRYAEWWLQADSSNRPTAIFAANDLMALGVIDVFTSNGVKIPDDVSIIGYDDLPLTSLAPISLTTIRQPHYEMGVTAMSFLSKRLEQEVDGVQRKIFRPELVIRKTTGAPKK
ncbi:LacI family DNA-binding transcriptional regulator [Alicyclobacillus fastidiosus]|uniref:LacI family DNA-binding transcriptional regulator n=1 Tax=Alicyclobacillus fastidiosus TaxID=392011 RepID=A0ABV5AKP2_9BACL|nr:LacI family DNA-binding transcriptional regulator [Alicyclobacillus fastidiosus]WEH08299.1 LacI family DNA-binding transcriptional regulator [Alicyclobacillus fastidiosus]